MAADLDRVISRWASAQATTRHDRSGDVPRPVLRTGSVLVAPASAERIAAVEAWLGVSLPPSYVTFLLTSNGAYAGTDLESSDGRQTRPGRDAPPSALLPVERVTWARHSRPWLVDLYADIDEVLAHGACTAHDSPPGCVVEHVGLNHATDVHEGHLQHALHIGTDVETDVFLDPLAIDGAGEWEAMVTSSGGNCHRYASFRDLLEVATETALDSLARDAHPDSGLPSLTELIHDPEPDPLADRIEAVLGDPEASVGLRSMAFHQLGLLDERDHGGRQARWIPRLLADPSFDDLNLLGAVVRGEITGPMVPTPGQVAGRGRPGDVRDLPWLTSDELLTIASEVGPEGMDGLADHLRLLALPPFDEPVPVLLADLRAAGVLDLPAHAAFAPAAAIEELSTDDLVQAGASIGASTAQIARALLLAAQTSGAVALLDAARGTEPETAIYGLAEIDEPEVWELLDRAADAPLPIALYGLLAAARTSSPLLPPRALRVLESEGFLGHFGLVALELQETEAAGDALLDLWRTGHLGALRALARRGDLRIVDDCVALLSGADPDLRLVGASGLRDLRDPTTEPMLLEALDAAGDEGSDDLIATIAQALVGLRSPVAARPMSAIAAVSPNPDLAAVLIRWSDQLT